MKFDNRGQTLVEALIALTIIVTIMSLTTIAVVTSLNNANYVKQQTQANKIAQEGMEYVRYQISQNNKFDTYIGYGNFMPPGSTRCFGTDVNSPPGGAQSSCPGVNIDSKYRRTVTFTNSQCGSAFTNGIQVLVSVEWQDGKCSGSTLCHTQSVASCFTNPTKATSSPVAPTGI